MSKNTGNIIAAFVTGAFVGMGVGMLLAPEKGSVIRKKIKVGFDSSKENIVEKLNDFVDEVKTKVHKVIPSLEKLLEQSFSSDKIEKEALIYLLQSKLQSLKNSK